MDVGRMSNYAFIAVFELDHLFIDKIIDLP
jgi:hypothetical protein